MIDDVYFFQIGVDFSIWFWVELYFKSADSLSLSLNLRKMSISSFDWGYYASWLNWIDFFPAGSFDDI